MNDDETLHSIALALALPMNYTAQNTLLEKMGSARAVFDHRHDILDVLPDATPHLRNAIANLEAYLPRGEEEMRRCEEKHIQVLAQSDPRYPQQLRGEADAPLVVYYCGAASLNALHMVSIVGTRKPTEYGKDLTCHFVEDLRALIPDVVVVSGLAYGIDVCAHRAALACHAPTIGVLAHGLNEIYPRVHRDVAAEMVEEGGLLTEYMQGSRIDKKNFVARNRIVAGLSAATVVVESATKGGSLITAGIALDYNREVMAFPGRATDESSAGCNSLIARHEASCIVSAESFVEAMGWQCITTATRRAGIQRQIFPTLTPDEERIVAALKGHEGKQVNLLTIETGLSVPTLASLLFDLEDKGVVRALAGGRYRLL